MVTNLKIISKLCACCVYACKLLCVLRGWCAVGVWGLHAATWLQISVKKLKKYEKEYVAIQEQQQRQEDPIERFEVCTLYILRKNSL